MATSTRTLRRFFTEENLTALRELALMRVANQVDEDLLHRWTKETIPDTRERVLVCVSRSEASEHLVRRGARIAQRALGDLLVVHVLSAEFEVLRAESAVDGVLAYAYRQHVTQIVVGKPLRSRWEELVHGSFTNKLIRQAAEIDIHVISRTST